MPYVYLLGGNLLMRTPHRSHTPRSQTVLTETHRGWAIEVWRRRTGLTIIRERFHVSIRNKAEASGYLHGFHSVATAFEAAQRFIRQYEGHQAALAQVQLRRKHAHSSRPAV